MLVNALAVPVKLVIREFRQASVFGPCAVIRGKRMGSVGIRVAYLKNIGHNRPFMCIDIKYANQKT